MTITIEEHPVWEELRRSSADALRAGMAAALTEDVRSRWARVDMNRCTTPTLDPLTAFVVAYREALRYAMAWALFDDVRPEWEQALAERTELNAA